MFTPLLVAVNAVPKITLGPLLVVALGWGQKPILTMVFLLCFFPIVLSTATGLTTTPADLAELVRSWNASRWQAFRKVRFPAALPQIFVGLKVAMPLAAIGAVIGEFQAGESGLGYVITQYAGIGDTATAWAAIMLVALVSILLYSALLLSRADRPALGARNHQQPLTTPDTGRPTQRPHRPSAAGAGRPRPTPSAAADGQSQRYPANRQRPLRATSVVSACGIRPLWLSGVMRIGPDRPSIWDVSSTSRMPLRSTFADLTAGAQFGVGDQLDGVRRERRGPVVAAEAGRVVLEPLPARRLGRRGRDHVVDHHGLREDQRGLLGRLGRRAEEEVPGRCRVEVDRPTEDGLLHAGGGQRRLLRRGPEDHRVGLARCELLDLLADVGVGGLDPLLSERDPGLVQLAS